MAFSKILEIKSHFWIQCTRLPPPPPSFWCCHLSFHIHKDTRRSARNEGLNWKGSSLILSLVPSAKLKLSFPDVSVFWSEWNRSSYSKAAYHLTHSGWYETNGMLQLPFSISRFLLGRSRLTLHKFAPFSDSNQSLTIMLSTPQPDFSVKW